MEEVKNEVTTRRKPKENVINLPHSGSVSLGWLERKDEEEEEAGEPDGARRRFW